MIVFEFCKRMVMNGLLAMIIIVALEQIPSLSQSESAELAMIFALVWSFVETLEGVNWEHARDPLS